MKQVGSNLTILGPVFPENCEFVVSGGQFPGRHQDGDGLRARRSGPCNLKYILARPRQYATVLGRPHVGRNIRRKRHKGSDPRHADGCGLAAGSAGQLNRRQHHRVLEDVLEARDHDGAFIQGNAAERNGCC